MTSKFLGEQRLYLIDHAPEMVVARPDGTVVGISEHGTHVAHPIGHADGLTEATMRIDHVDYGDADT